MFVSRVSGVSGMCMLSIEGTIAPLEQIVTPELFNAHITIKAIGIWKCDSGHNVIGDNRTLVFHIPLALREIGHE